MIEVPANTPEGAAAFAPGHHELVIATERLQRLADVIPFPEGYRHYRVMGEWDTNRSVYTVQEADAITTEYSCRADKDPKRGAQFFTKKSFRLEQRPDGKAARKDVQFNFNTGKWEDRGILHTIRDIFKTVPDILGSVREEKGGDGEAAPRHILDVTEKKRPVGENVGEAKIDTLEDLLTELELKGRHHELYLRTVREMSRQLKDENSQLRDSLYEERQKRIRVEQTTYGTGYYASRASRQRSS